MSLYHNDRSIMNKFSWKSIFIKQMTVIEWTSDVASCLLNKISEPCVSRYWKWYQTSKWSRRMQKLQIFSIAPWNVIIFGTKMDFWHFWFTFNDKIRKMQINAYIKTQYLPTRTLRRFELLLVEKMSCPPTLARHFLIRFFPNSRHKCSKKSFDEVPT